MSDRAALPLCRSTLRCLLLLALAGCRESVTAPGLCPEFCLAGEFAMRDTILSNVIAADSSFVGYRFATHAYRMQVAGSGGPVESRGLVTFTRFFDTYGGSDSSASRTILTTDSFRLSFNLVRRSPAPGLALLVYRVGIRPDTATTWDDVAPFFDDTALVGSIPIDDTLQTGTVAAAFPAGAFPAFEPDSFMMSVGLRVAGPAFADISTVDSITATVLVRYTSHDSVGTTVTRSEARAAFFDTFLGDPASLGTLGLRVGGLPAARVLLRASVPANVVDSTQVVRATLLLVPAQPALGAAGDTFRLRVHALGADFGAKSPLIIEGADTLEMGSTKVAVGTGDTIRIDITHVLQAWRASATLPRSMMLRLVPEAASVAALDLLPSSSPAGRPSLHLTYIPLYRFPGR